MSTFVPQNGKRIPGRKRTKLDCRDCRHAEWCKSKRPCSLWRRP